MLNIQEGSEGAEVDCSPMGGATVPTSQTSRSSWELDHQPKSTHGRTHGSSCICGTGWSCWTPVGGVVQCPSTGECHDEKAGVGRGGWVEEHPHSGNLVNVSL